MSLSSMPKTVYGRQTFMELLSMRQKESRCLVAEKSRGGNLMTLKMPIKPTLVDRPTKAQEDEWCDAYEEYSQALNKYNDEITAEAGKRAKAEQEEKQHRLETEGRYLTELIEEALAERGETWDHIIYHTISNAQLNERYMPSEGPADPFLLWTEKRVYAVGRNICDETWITSLPRELKIKHEGFLV